MGDREMEVNSSSFHVSAHTAELVREGLLSVRPAAQTRPSKLPMTFWDKIMDMHGQGVRLVLEKDLCATDVDRSKGHLSIPKGKIQEKFLTDQEIRALDDKHMTVSLIEPCLRVRHGLKLQKWKRNGKFFSYVLTKEWNAVTHSNARNRLEKGCPIRLWAFRVNGDLHFCLVNREAASADVENMAIRE